MDNLLAVLSVQARTTARNNLLNDAPCSFVRSALRSHRIQARAASKTGTLVYCNVENGTGDFLSGLTNSNCLKQSSSSPPGCGLPSEWEKCRALENGSRP